MSFNQGTTAGIGRVGRREESGRWGPYRQASPPPARHRPGARSARREGARAPVADRLDAGDRIMWTSNRYLRFGASRKRPTRPAHRRPPTLRPHGDALEARRLLSGVDVVSADPNDWPMYNHDPEGTRNNFAEHRLGPETVGDLQ